MVYEVLRNLKLCIKKERLSFARGENCLFFKNDSCLSNCLPVFSQKVFDNGKLKVELSSKGFGARASE
jgi:hypothetical protein